MTSLFQFTSRFVSNRGNRRRSCRRKEALQAVDILETRTLLSAANAAPVITEVSSILNFVSVTIEDADPGYDYIISIDEDGDGEADQSFSVDLGTTVIEVGEVAANDSTNIYLQVEEHYLVYPLLGTNESNTVVVAVHGPELVATPIESFDLVGNVGAGVLAETTNISGTVRLMIREVGAAAWIDSEEVHGNEFITEIVDADGEKDFELKTRTNIGGVYMDSASIILEDVLSMEQFIAANLPESESEAGETEAGETEAGETEAGETEAGETEAGETGAMETDPAANEADEEEAAFDDYYADYADYYYEEV